MRKYLISWLSSARSFYMLNAFKQHLIVSIPMLPSYFIVHPLRVWGVIQKWPLLGSSSARILALWNYFFGHAFLLILITVFYAVVKSLQATLYGKPILCIFPAKISGCPICSNFALQQVCTVQCCSITGLAALHIWAELIPTRILLATRIIHPAILQGPLCAFMDSGVVSKVQNVLIYLARFFVSSSIRILLSFQHSCPFSSYFVQSQCLTDGHSFQHVDLELASQVCAVLGVGCTVRSVMFAVLFQYSFPIPAPYISMMPYSMLIWDSGFQSVLALVHFRGVLWSHSLCLFPLEFNMGIVVL